RTRRLPIYTLFPYTTLFRSREGAPRGSADLSLRRLLGLPLVPRDAERRVLRGGDRTGAQPRFRLRQGGSRGATRRGRALPGRGAATRPAGRVAALGLSHTGWSPLFRWHVFPAARRPWTTELSARPRGRDGRLEPSPRRDREDGGRDRPRAFGIRGRGARRGRERAGGHRALRGGGEDPLGRRRGPRRLLRRSQISASA